MGEAGDRWNGSMATVNVGEVLADQGRVEEGRLSSVMLSVSPGLRSPDARVGGVGAGSEGCSRGPGGSRKLIALLGEARDEYRDAASLGEL